MACRSAEIGGGSSTQQPLDEQSLQANAFAMYLQESRLLLKDGRLLLHQTSQKTREIG